MTSATIAPERGRALTSRLATVRRPPIHGLTSWFGVGALAAYLLIATLGRWVSEDPNLLITAAAEPPSWQHWFGTDHLGRDVFARTAAGAWTSLLISLGSVLVGLVLSLPLGMLAGYHHGGRTDGAIMRALETVQALPMFVFVMFVISLTGTEIIDVGPFEIGMGTRLVLCLGLGFVPFFARIARAATLVEMQEDYVAGLKVLGVPRRTILTSEILVNVLPAVMVQAFLAMAIAIFAEGGLSFIGLGVALPQATLGNLISDAGSQILEGDWWYALFPGVVMVVGILGFNLVGDALNDALTDSGAGAEQGRAS